MNLLLTNDDGYGAAGLECLKNRLKADGHKVYVLAPDGNRSAVSHGMTFASLDFKKINDCEWTCSGKPVDCVVSALRSDMFPEKIDAVLAGINAGFNLGSDIVYSGTCAAARQAVMYNVPGIALSVEPDGDSSYVDPFSAGKLKYDFNGMADFVSRNIEALVGLAKTDVPVAFVNVNAVSGAKYKEAVVCNRLSNRIYDDVVTLGEPVEGNLYKSTFRGNHPESAYEPDSDYTAIAEGKVSVSVVYAEPVACAVDGIDFSL